MYWLLYSSSGKHLHNNLAKKSGKALVVPIIPVAMPLLYSEASKDNYVRPLWYVKKGKELQAHYLIISS